MADLLAVGPQTSLADLLAQVEAHRPAPGEGTLRIWIPRGAWALREMEDYQALRATERRLGIHLKLLTPDARMVGLALVFNLDAEIRALPPADPPVNLAARPSGRVPPAMPPAAPVAPPPAASAPAQPAASLPLATPPEADRSLEMPSWAAPVPSGTRPLTMPEPPRPVPEGTRSLRFPPGERVAGGTRPLEMPDPPEPDRAPGSTRPLVMPEPPAAQAAPPVPPLPRAPQPSATPPPAPSAPPSENDWLYSGDVDVAAILAEDDRSRLLSAQPPSELTGRLMELPPPPPPAPPVHPAAAAPAPPPAPPSPDVPASLVDDQRPLPAVEFSEWMAMQAAAAGTPPPVYPGTPPSRDELARLPAWVRSALAATGAPPTPSVATPRPATRPGPTRVPVPAPVVVPPILGGRAVSPLAGPPEAEAAAVEARRRSRTEKLFEHLARPQDADVVLRCPHCGEVLDKDELLRQLERALNP